jgi:soluble lytic murein transglycosylase
LLLKQDVPIGEGWVVRDGTWKGQPIPSLPEIEGPDAYPGVQVGLWPTETPILQTETGSRRGLETPASTADLSMLQWPFSLDARAYLAPREKPLPIITTAIPNGYQASTHHSPDKAMKILKEIGEEYQEIWPDMLEAYHLAEAGMYGESGPIVRAAYAEFRAPNKVWNATRRAKIKAVKTTKAEWAEAARAARDHHFAVKHVWGTKKSEEIKDFERLQFPVAYAQELWPHCQKWNIDPFLVLAIMRQESIYNPDALSHTGAIGLMQFIKGTGAKVSAMLEEPFFSPHTLYDPSVNLRYAVYYIRLLNDRFGGNFPIAVASYNGGPHHMSRAHRDTFGSLSLDAFVEMIPREEPRNYVKKVVGYYQRYVELYGPSGAQVMVPKRLTYDDPSVVNF